MQDRLTERETEILALLAKGKCAKEIAVELNMAVKTVETHRARVYRKMETHTTVETVLLAIRLGMVACPCMGRERERADSWYFGA
jgi:DNA-binding NarL/FixJ family response regulator